MDERNTTEIVMEPIGIVHSDCKVSADLPKGGGASNVVATIEIDARYEEGIADISVGDKLMVVFYFHLSKEALLTVPLMGNGPMVGVFSSHSPTRPNFIGITEVVVEGKEGLHLVIKGADMLDGTPVLDFKPVPTQHER